MNACSEATTWPDAFMVLGLALLLMGWFPLLIWRVTR